jgi:polyhydroxyalkanoate synthesis regulator phasin
MSQELHDVANSNKPWAAERAATALQIQSAVANGEISNSEARELLEDLVRTDQLESEADDIAIKTMLVTGVFALIQVLG